MNPDGATLRHVRPSASDERKASHGVFTLAPTDPIVAGTPVQVSLRFTGGARGLGVGDSLGLAWRLPCDWGRIQADDPAAPNYVTAHAPAGVRLRLQYQDRGGVKPWHHLFLATVTEGNLSPGSEIGFTLGDRSGGSRGWDAQRAAVRSHRFQGLLRLAAEDDWLELPGLPEIEIVGGAPEALSGSGPSDCRAGVPVELTVRLTDGFGNASRGGPDDIVLEAPSLRVLSVERVGSPSAIDVWKAVAQFDAPGRYRVRVHVPSLGLTTECNPIDCTDGERSHAVYWGDLHAGQCEMGCGQGTLREFFWHARYVAALQFASHQPNDVYVTREDWRHARAVADEVNAEGEFVAFHGCEWTSLPRHGGDRNVFYLKDQPVLHRAGRWYREDDPDTWQDAEDPAELYECLSDTEALINLHAGGFTSELDWEDDRLEGLVEVHSTHGTSRWLVEAALEQGRRFGVSAGTDGIAGRPGACLPGARETRNVPNGCFGVYAPGLSRQDLWRSIQARRCFGTDGERIRLAVRAGEAFMGEELTVKRLPPLEIEVAGTAAIERVIVRRGTSVIAMEDLWVPDPRSPRRYRLTWTGTEEHGSFHAQALEWTGTLRAAGGPLEVVSTVGYFGETDELTQEEGAISWRSTTAGNIVGFLFDAASDGRDRLTLKCNLVDMEANLPARSVVRRSIESALGTGRVALSRAPDPDGSPDCRLEIDLGDAPGRGTHAYWVEVIQVNGSRAWSSPIFVTFE